jgi:hypothetical protein
MRRTSCATYLVNWAATTCRVHSTRSSEYEMDRVPHICRGTLACAEVTWPALRSMHSSSCNQSKWLVLYYNARRDNNGRIIRPGLMSGVAI